MSSGIPLPQEAVITRWGTWISAAIYQSENFDFLKSIFDFFDEDDAESIEIAKELFKKSKIKSDLSFISANFNTLVSTIKTL